jgi:hypothetical protein
MAAYNSTVTCGATSLDGTFAHTPPNPPNVTSGSVIRQYTLTPSNSTLQTTGASSVGASVRLSITSAAPWIRSTARTRRVPEISSVV